MGVVAEGYDAVRTDFLDIPVQSNEAFHERGCGILAREEELGLVSAHLLLTCIRQVDIFPSDAGCGEELIEFLSRVADERSSLLYLVVSWCLADYHQLGVSWSLSGYHGVACLRLYAAVRIRGTCRKVVWP